MDYTNSKAKDCTKMNQHRSMELDKPPEANGKARDSWKRSDSVAKLWTIGLNKQKQWKALGRTPGLWTKSTSYRFMSEDVAPLGFPLSVPPPASVSLCMK